MSADKWTEWRLRRPLRRLSGWVLWEKSKLGWAKPWARTLVSSRVGLWQVLQSFLLFISILSAGCCPLSQSGHKQVVWQRWLVKLVFCENSYSWCCSLPRLRLSGEEKKNKKCQDIHLSCTSANLSLTLKLAAAAPLWPFSKFPQCSSIRVAAVVPHHSV